jgi:hypothetical protein
MGTGVTFSEVKTSIPATLPLSAVPYHWTAETSPDAQAFVAHRMNYKSYSLTTLALLKIDSGWIQNSRGTWLGVK